MINKKFILILFSLSLSKLLFCQEFAIDNGANIFSATGSFTSQGHNIIKDEGSDRITTINLGILNNRFIMKGLFIGYGFELKSQFSGENSYLAFGLGPQIGYAFGNSENKVFPFVGLGAKYFFLMNHREYQCSDYQFFDISGNVGLIIPLKGRLGINIEFGYHSIMYMNSLTPDYVVGLGIGIVGLFY